MDGLPQQPGWTGRLPQVEEVNQEELFLKIFSRVLFLLM